MAEYRLSALASEDLAEIADYTEKRWGLTQAYRYVSKLKETFELVAAHPNLGRACESLSPGYRRIEQGSHVVFYRPAEHYVLIGRILHQRMMPNTRVLEDS